MNVTDLDDPIAVAAYLTRLRHDVDVDDAELLAEDALEFSSPPAGAWTVLARVAEHRGDYVRFERWTAAALDVDGDFDPSVEDHEYLEALRGPGTRKAGAALRADRVFEKLCAFSNRVANLQASIDLAVEVTGAINHEAFDVAESALFTACLVFDAGLVHRFAATAAAVLPPGERTLVDQWLAASVRHRHVRMVEQSRRRWTLSDIQTGEVLVADTLIETWWAAEREGFVVVAPVGSKLAVVGEPILFPPAQRAEARVAVAARERDSLAVARTALRWRFDHERGERSRFCFPDASPDDVPTDEEALLAFVAERMPDAAELEQLLEAITAHRILTRRTPHTWDYAAALLAAGHTRDAVWEATAALTYRELWLHAQDDAA